MQLDSDLKKLKMKKKCIDPIDNCPISTQIDIKKSLKKFNMTLELNT